MKCKSEGHDKYHCLVFPNYIVAGQLMHLRSEAQAGPSAGRALWCVICEVAGEVAMNSCHLLKKIVQTLQQLSCNFCWSVGHDESNCRSYELMMDRTPTYKVQA